jgi:hypothetical protein
MTEHSQHCHCVCTDLAELQAAIEQARQIHLQPEPKTNCIMCGTTTGSCDNCKWVKNCIVCAELWPCDTFIALDLETN